MVKIGEFASASLHWIKKEYKKFVGSNQMQEIKNHHDFSLLVSLISNHIFRFQVCFGKIIIYPWY